MNIYIIWLSMAVLGGLYLFEHFPGFMVTTGLFTVLVYFRLQWLCPFIRLVLSNFVPAWAISMEEENCEDSDQRDPEEEKLAKKEELVKRLNAVGLSSEYWLPTLQDKHGVTSAQALEHLQYEDYLKLECQVQYPWEKQALRTLLNIAESKATMKQLQEERLERLKKQKEQVKAALQELKEMQHEGKIHHNEAVRRKEEELWVAMEIPQEYWAPSEKPLMEVLDNAHKQLGLLEQSVSQSENLPDEEVLRRASGGLALQGIYKTHKLSDMLETREQLVNIPEGFELFGPQQGPLFANKEFSSSEAESTFTKAMEKLGFSISVAAKGGFGGFSAETSSDYSSSSESEETHKSRSEHTYICTTKYSYIPLASCYFPKAQLRLSSAALQELKVMEQLLSHSPEPDKINMVKSRGGSFFKRFGSHVNQGPLHLGGIFWWKASSAGFRAEQLDEVKKQTSDALSSYVGGSYSGFGLSISAGVTVSKSGSEASFQGTDRKRMHTEIQLFVTKTGGPPETHSLTQWQSGLVTSNKTWSVIDRGFQLIPVWEIILSNHGQDFRDVHQISSSLRNAYEVLTNQSVGTLFGEGLASAVDEARLFLEEMKSWEVTGVEEQLVKLINFKQKLTEKTKNYSVWINICLSDKGLQDFLENTVSLCKDLPAQNTVYIRSLLRCLLDPHVYSVKNFPKSSSIMQWIFREEKKQQKNRSPSEFADFIQVLQEMKDYIQEVTYDPMSSAAAVQEAKEIATLNVSLALSSFLQALREKEQTDIELLLLSIAASTGYRVERNTFQYLLGCPKINFMLKEMQKAHEEYLSHRDQNVSRAQASLLLTGLTVTAEFKDVTPEEKNKRLTFMKHHMGKLLSDEIANVLKNHSARNDWDVLERDLNCLLNRDFEAANDNLQKQDTIKELEDSYQRAKPSKLEPKVQSTDFEICGTIENQEFLNLMKRLGLERYYPRKMGTDSFHIISNISLHDSQPSTEDKLPFYFLQRLLMVDYRVRYLVCKDDGKAKPSVTRVLNTSNEGSDLSDTFDVFFYFCEGTNESAGTRQTHVHPMDIQMAIFHCADDFMRQHLSTKLAFCQFALPLLVPDPSTSQIEFPVLALCQVKKSWKGAEKSGGETSIKNYNKLMYQAHTHLVSFIRIGNSPHSSKSQILNALLSKHKHDIFFHRHCRGSSKDCLLMNGVVEISWYCPGGKDDDRFDNCIAFTNLHGDAREHEQQVTFLQEIASINVVLLSDTDQNDKRGKQIIRDLWQSQKPLICLFAEKENIVAGKSSQNVGIGIKNRNEAELIDEITATIKDFLAGSIATCSLDACVKTAREHGFLIDEDKEECKEAKDKAKKLMDHFKNPSLASLKEKLLPLQGELWHKWCKKDKELTRLQEKSNISIEQYRSQIESDKDAIRRDQLSKVSPPNDLMKSVLEFLQSHPEDTKKYFLQWMKVFMDDLSSDHLAELHQKYHNLWSEMLIKKKEENNLKTRLQNDLEKLSTEINNSTFGLEHILREVGQIYEALDATVQKDKCFLELHKIAADLMVSGYPIELMDGDASYVPLKWVGAVFDSLIETLEDRKVFVLSVLGIQSTGKSTLLNAMFGLQFSVSAGRCTRGAFMQLIKVDENLQQDLNFDYILVVDTEGLRAIEKANKLSLNHDNELATFVIGIGNMTVINIFGENPSEMQDILQIAVQAFLRMKQVNLSPSCLFVHQNVGDITAKEQNMEGQRRLQQKLDEMTVTAAQQEFCDVTCFSDVIRFDLKTHIHYFAHLWEGDPPMAPPNPSYSQNVQELKSYILKAANKESRGSVLRLSGLKVRIGDLWNALLNENFIFSFKNTLEIAAYNRLETMFSQWTWELRSHMLELQIKLNNQIRNKEMLQITRESLEGEVKEKYGAIIDQLEKYFSEDPDAEILIQWKANIEIKLTELKMSLIDKTMRKSEELIILRNNQSKLDEEKSEYENELFKRSQELALSLKGKKSSENELRENFNLLWGKWVYEMSSDVPPVEEPNISLDIENILLERFKQKSVVAKKIKVYSSKNMFSTDFSKHVTIKKTLFVFKKNLEKCDRDTIDQVTDRITQGVRAMIDSKEQQRLDYNASYFQEILNKIRQEVDSASNNPKYTFNDDYIIDLSVYLCKMATGRFEDLHTAFKTAHDPTVYLESKREDFFKCFQISCQGAAFITTFADFLCTKLSAALRQAVYDKTAIDIAREMKSTLPAFNGNRLNLENYILVYLAEKEDFEEYKRYIQSPKYFFEDFIKQRVDDYCLDKNNPKLKSFLNNSLDSFHTLVLSAIRDATEVTKDRRGNVSLWLDEFCRRLLQHLTLPRDDLKSIEHQEVTDIEFLKEAMSKALALVVENLKQDFAVIDMGPFSRKPHEILAEQLGGCWEKCPFCTAPCTNTIAGHDGKHSVPFHRPQAVAGWYFHTTDNLVPVICSSLVASDKHYRLSEDKRIPYKTYWEGGRPYSDWSIKSDMSEQSYWKWFVCHFKTKLEELHGKKFEGYGEIPSQWKNITKDNALRELKKLCPSVRKNNCKSVRH
ncbi:interferon-induced very large GTPase 1-like [Trachemys scripta elegans]|uniref:interferon-induced very large GTPase 1-like n=1 Tax=Trachemys scripta elegans TaxID=31138 RepID=UPI001551DBAD|nr:interferon-induced very large GTPase 1-like [Trachemys scripta elegans]